MCCLYSNKASLELPGLTPCLLTVCTLCGVVVVVRALLYPYFYQPGFYVMLVDSAGTKVLYLHH